MAQIVLRSLFFEVNPKSKRVPGSGKAAYDETCRKLEGKRAKIFQDQRTKLLQGFMLRFLHPRDMEVDRARRYFRYWRMHANQERRDYCLQQVALKLRAIYHKVSTLVNLIP